MRTTSQNFGVIENNGEIIGISLGADYCAEHECGIRWARDFGIDLKISRENFGIPSRTNTKADMELTLKRVKIGKGKASRENLVLFGVQTNTSVFWTLAGLVERFGGVPAKKAYRELTEEEKAMQYFDQPMADIRTAWSDRMGFMVIAQTPKGEEAISVVHDAITNNRCVIGYGSSANPFSRSGINMIDTDKLPQEIIEAVAAEDLEHLSLIEDAAATGIEDRLRNAGIRWFALAPRRDPEGIKFFLNPYEQQNNNFGWFTVAELDQWIEGKGPIPKVA